MPGGVAGAQSMMAAPYADFTLNYIRLSSEKHMLAEVAPPTIPQGKSKVLVHLYQNTKWAQFFTL